MRGSPSRLRLLHELAKKTLAGDDEIDDGSCNRLLCGSPSGVQESSSSMRNRLAKITAATLTLVVWPGCDGAHEDLPDLQQCQSGMEEIARMPGQTGTRDLLWHDGRLYFDGLPPVTGGTVAPSGIMVLPEDGGSASLFLATDVWNMWSDGDSIVYAMGDNFYTVPFAGSEAQLVAAGATNEDHLAEIDAQNMDENYFYWLSSSATGQPSTSVWAKPRSGGANIAIGEIPSLAHPQFAATYPTPQGLLIAATVDVGHAWFVDKTTWQWRALADLPQEVFPAGGMYIDARGAYWRTYLGGNGRDERYGVFQSDVAGDPLKPYWPSMPSHFATSTMLSDRAGGWAVSGIEWFSDGHMHASYWTVDAQQVGHRQACPAAADLSSEIVAAAWSPSYVFLAVFTWPEGGADYYTSIWRFPRVP